VDAFRGNHEMADSVNQLLVAGFYPISIGYVTHAVRIADSVTTARRCGTDLR
jgi:hypothetical protein